MPSFEKVPTRLDLVAGEHEVLAFWERTQAFETLRRRNAGKPKWSFLDGPITANNPMGVHHAWGRTYKDCYQRYFAMTGHELRYQNGFDCQGLWVEVEVEKELGFRDKRDIEQYGLDRFVEACKERVRKYSAIQTAQSVRLGYWMDWNNSYYTMSDENNYTIWAFLKKCHQRRLIYRGMDAMPWCPRCGTGISEQERREGYRNIEDLSVFLRLPLHGRPGEYLLVWTTTPWTLAANVACAVHPDLIYAKVRQGAAVYYLARDCLGVLQSEGPLEVLGEQPGRSMLGWTYDGPFDELPAGARVRGDHRVIPWAEVSAGEGTGIVHIAPGCGKEDFDLAPEQDIAVLVPIDDTGCYIGGEPVRLEVPGRRVYIGGYGALAGKRASEVAPEVFAHLRARGMYYKHEAYRHDYPHCWRCSTPLLFRAVEEWFIDMSWRDEIKRVVDQITWIPEWGRDQELDWLTNMGDWMISKKRYWGLALPIFVCEGCGQFDVVGGREELKARAVEGWERFEGHSPHRPWVDAVKIGCPACGGRMSRIPDVGNPWLDAGIVPYSTVRYNTDREYWRQWIPADLVTECFPGQFRNWFYALLAMSTMMEGIAPFRTLLGHALVRDEQGEEMHKSTGNAIWFDDAAEKMGVDVMRWIFCRQSPTVNLNFGYTVGQLTERKVFNTWWNTYAFFANYARLDGFDPRTAAVPVDQRPDIDRWLLSKLHALVRLANIEMPRFNVAAVVRQAEDFLDLLSNWYVRRNRRRFWRARGADDRDKLAAYQTLYTALETFCRLLAPVVPFVTERMYQNLVRTWNAEAPSSVHHTDYPQADERLIDEALSRQMEVAVEVVRQGLSIRETHGLRVRQPLAELRVAASSASHRAAVERFAGHVLDELNVKRLTTSEDFRDLVDYELKPKMAVLGPKFGPDTPAVLQYLRAMDGRQVAAALTAGTPLRVEHRGRVLEVAPGDIELVTKPAAGWIATETGEVRVALDTRLTPELELEGLARDVVRHVQQTRKEAGLEIEDRIHLALAADDPQLIQAIETWREYIGAETLADDLSTAAPAEAKTVTLHGHRLRIAVRKV